MGITIVRGNITRDHVHMLVSCTASIAPSKVGQYLKDRSSNLIEDI